MAQTPDITRDVGGFAVLGQAIIPHIFGLRQVKEGCQVAAQRYFDLTAALPREDRKRSPKALLAFRVTSMVVRPEARSFKPALWSTQMTTRRRKCTAV